MRSLRMALMTHGTRGDVQPLVALGREFMRRGHRPVLAVPAGAAGFVRAAGLEVEPLPGDWQEFLSAPAAGRDWLTSGDNRKVLAGLRDAMAGHSGAIAQALLRVTENADLIVSGSLTEDIATVLAEARNIPLALLHAFPVRSNDALPSPFSTGPGTNRETHVAYERASWESRRDGINQLRKALGLAPTTTPTPERARRLGAIELQAYSGSVVQGLNWPGHRPLIGWLDLDDTTRHAVGEQGLSPELEEWLAAGPAPAYFGFGSMPVADPLATVTMIEQTVTRLGMRAVIAAGWAGLPADAIKDPARVHMVKTVDHATLLPRCRFAVHHGGSGTTAAAIRAGIPSLVCSVMLDQALWGSIIESHGTGVHLPLRDLDAESLRTAIEQVVRPGIVAAADALGRTVRAERDAVRIAADITIAHATSRVPGSAHIFRMPRRTAAGAAPYDTGSFRRAS